MNTHASITIASASAQDAALAVAELRPAFAETELALLLFFCSSHYDLPALAQALNNAFPHTLIVGCTTAGEIGPQGYVTHTLVAAGFASTAFRAVAGGLPAVGLLDAETCNARIRALQAQLPQGWAGDATVQRFALHLIDGMSRREEMTVHWVQRSLADWPLVGGSAGDNLQFARPQVYFDGAFHDAAAVVVLVETICPVKLFKTQHFVPGKIPMVVTEADPETRTVFEINGRLAADEYASLLGVKVADLHAPLLAENPVMVRLGGVDYVRAVRTVNGDGSLSFYCAIERGLVLRVGHGAQLLENLQATLQDIHDSLGTPQLLLAFDCVFRRLDIEAKGLVPAINQCIVPMHAMGFSTYGEQWMGVHINQTLTGLAIGAAPDCQEASHG